MTAIATKTNTEYKEGETVTVNRVNYIIRNVYQGELYRQNGTVGLFCQRPAGRKIYLICVYASGYMGDPVSLI